MRGETDNTAIQAARLGIDVVLVERTSWLGGMLTAAGVSCVDGNYELPSGIFGEFRQRIFDYYGGPEKVKTGWVSHVNFEPHVGNKILHEMVADLPNLTIYKNHIFKNVEVDNKKICEVKFANQNGESLIVKPKIVIDATEYGDLAAAAGCQYDTGLDNADQDYEKPAIQDITWVAILQKYDDQVDRTIAKPDSYDSGEFEGCCAEVATEQHSCDISAERMMTYGQLPNNKYMLNWPRQGNDYFASILEDTEENREKVWQKAREFTRNMIYFLQNELGYKNIGIADEFPSEHGLALIPYNRESRRFYGLNRMQVKHILYPYQFEYYKSGIAVGDYPLDHHHDRNPEKVDEEYPPIPSYNVPYGCLVSQDLDNLLLAEKNISVSHMVNGTTRLQPVVMQLGQAAGAAASLAIQDQALLSKLAIRKLQNILLDNGSYLMPFIDVDKDDPAFEAVQKAGVTGLFQGEGVPYKWANKTYFHPDKEFSGQDLKVLARAFGLDETESLQFDDKKSIELEKIIDLISAQYQIDISDIREQKAGKPITRSDLAVLLDKKLDLFNKFKLFLNEEE